MEELKKYFSDLLILQYKNKPRAKATIEALVQNAFSDTTGNIFPIKVQNSYNLDTATGDQLDVLGKYLGRDRVLAFAIDNTFKYATYDLSSNPDTGYNDYQEEVISYPYAEYRYAQYSYETIKDDNYRLLLKMLAFLRGKPLTLENIDLALELAFDGYIYAIEKPKEIEYHVAQGFFPLLTDQSRLDTAFKKYFPKPMGCSMTVVRDPMFLNLIPHGGAENFVDENFIFTRENPDGSIFFETPIKFDFYNPYEGNSIEIKSRIKINADEISSSGFWTTLQNSDNMNSLALIRAVTVFSAIIDNTRRDFGSSSSDWLDITLTINARQYNTYTVWAIIEKDGEVITSVDTMFSPKNLKDFSLLWGITGGLLSTTPIGLKGSIDFKGCSVTINDEIVWKGITNKRLKGV